MHGSGQRWAWSGALVMLLLVALPACDKVSPPTFCEVGGACAEASPERCADGPEARDYGRSVFLGRSCVAGEADACRNARLTCARFGQCMVPQRPGSVPANCTGARIDADHRAANAPRCAGFATCIASSDEDCRASGVCTAEGRCVARDGVCAAANDDDCRNSNHCAALGWCQRVETQEGPRCRAGNDADCHGSHVCRGPGQCAVAGGECVACARSDGCRRDGSCSLDGQACRALSDADCRRSEACRNGGRCRASRGVCVKAG